MASYIRTSDHLTVVFDSGETVTVYPSNPQFSQIVVALKAKDYVRVRELSTPAVVIQKKLDRVARRGRGQAELRDGIVYYNGESIHNTLTERLIQMANEGFDVEPMIRFLENLQQNPSFRAVTELYGFLEKGNLPITEDGFFLAYKRVRNDFTDCHTGKMSNAIDTVVEMARNKVNEDPKETCSIGLHFCSRDYLPNFGTDTGNRTVILKINPADVVAIPVDYNSTKGRCCRYEVIGELEHLNEAPIEGAFRPSDDYEEPVDDYDDCGLSSDYDKDYNTGQDSDDFALPTPVRAEFLIQAMDGEEVVREFDDIYEAANWASVAPSAIRRVIKGDRKTTAGYGWQHVGVSADPTEAHPVHLADHHEHGTLLAGKPHGVDEDDIDDMYDLDDYED